MISSVFGMIYMSLFSWIIKIYIQVAVVQKKLYLKEAMSLKVNQFQSDSRLTDSEVIQD